MIDQTDIRSLLIKKFQQTRAKSEHFASMLSAEDMSIQSMPDVSPTKWHLAHTTWFFETFILKQFESTFAAFNDLYAVLFNSYYNLIGEQYPRHQRGLITRPNVSEILDYRQSITERVCNLLNFYACSNKQDKFSQIAKLVELGIHHEQQHQELMITDIKHVFSHNPSYPSLSPIKDHKDSRITKTPLGKQTQQNELSWHAFQAGIYQIGYQGDQFYFDNEAPVHRRFLEDFKIASRPVLNSEYIEFIEDGGYSLSNHWLSEGWSWVQSAAICAPLYWFKKDSRWFNYTLAGLTEVQPNEPVTHISYFEADAFASWAGKRLPTETEWEVAAISLFGHVPSGNRHASDEPSCKVQDTFQFHPKSLCFEGANQKHTFYTDVWNWTSSAYDAYPGFQTSKDAIGEYNGKFMCNQYVLRGGSCATPSGHIRASYRNFFPANTRWQFSGLRLAKNI